MVQPDHIGAKRDFAPILHPETASNAHHQPLTEHDAEK